MAITSEKSGALDVSFAFSHAVNLAEAGRTLQDKRIGAYIHSVHSHISLLMKQSSVGYLFCNELLPKNHDMQLMLVNTLRKVCL
jgi:AP-4 complex subunit epsilon-1